MNRGKSIYLELANKIADQFKTIATVEAIALGGSQTSGSLDNHSDIDLYVYANEVIPLSKRQEIVAQLGASKTDLNLTFWDLGDEWYDLDTGIEVDIIYWDPSWIEEQLDRVLITHQASMGYTTCFWHTILNSKTLFDRHGWFAHLQQKCAQPYPETLQRAIINKNHSVLRAVIPSYYGQIKKALERNDLISVNHRVAALFASYFDILFAMNKMLHPGEKKLLRFVLENCEKVPPNLEQHLEAIFKLAGTGDADLLHYLDSLLDAFDSVLVQKNLFPGE